MQGTAYLLCVSLMACVDSSNGSILKETMHETQDSSPDRFELPVADHSPHSQESVDPSDRQQKTTEKVFGKLSDVVTKQETILFWTICLLVKQAIVWTKYALLHS